MTPSLVDSTPYAEFKPMQAASGQRHLATEQTPPKSIG